MKKLILVLALLALICPFMGMKLYLTNTSSSGQTQSDPNASLGGYRSTTELSATSMKNLFDDVSVVEALLGDTEYRMIDVYNDGTGTAYGVQLYMQTATSSSSTELDFGYSSTNQPHADAWNGEALSNESTAPASPSMSFSNYTKTSPLSLGTIPASQSKRVCVRRTVTAGAPWTAHDLGRFGVRWGGVAASSFSWGTAPASNNVWYSCSPFGTGDLKTGSPTITIETGGKATLTVAQTGNIGQGDRVTYNTSTISYIAKVVDSSHFYLVTATGGVPANVSGQTVNSIAHEYASLSAAEAGASDSNHINNTSLVTADVVLNIVCYYDHDDYTPDSTACTVNGYTTDATRYINIYTPTGGTQSINSQRHSGILSTSRYLLLMSDWTTPVLVISDASRVHITGLQLRYGVTSYDVANPITNITGESPDITYDSCIICCTSSNNTRCIGAQIGAAATVRFSNSIIYGTYLADDYGNSAIKEYYQSATITLYNCTISDNHIGVGRRSSTMTIVNCAIFNNMYDVESGATVTYTASDDTISGTGNVNISPGATETTDWASAFTDYANGDFSIKDTDSVLYDAGIVQSGVTTDIIGTSRGSVGGACDIGAFEYVAAAGNKWNTITPSKWNGVNWADMDWNK